LNILGGKRLIMSIITNNVAYIIKGITIGAQPPNTAAVLLPPVKEEDG